MTPSLHHALITAALTAAALFPLRAADGRIPIASVPYTITQPGVYYLTRDLTLASGSAITVNASNVEVDLAGHTLTLGDTFGIPIAIGSTSGNIRITNGRLLGGQFGVDIEPSVADAFYQLDHLTLSGQSFAGIYVFPPTLGTFSRVVIEDNNVTASANYGIELAYIENGRIERNLVNHCQLGFYIRNSQFNRIDHNVITGNTGNGIYLTTSNHNTLDWNSAVGNGNTGFNLNNGGNNIYSNNRLSGNTSGNVFTAGVSAGGNNAGAANF